MKHRILSTCIAALVLASPALAAPVGDFDVAFELLEDGSSDPIAAGASRLENGKASFVSQSDRAYVAGADFSTDAAGVETVSLRPGTVVYGHDVRIAPSRKGGKVYVTYDVDVTELDGFVEMKANGVGVEGPRTSTIGMADVAQAVRMPDGDWRYETRMRTGDRTVRLLIDVKDAAVR